MANEKRLIYADKIKYEKVREGGWGGPPYYIAYKSTIDEMPTVDAVEVVRIEEVKQEILQQMDMFIAEYRRISKSYVDHFGGKADAMEVARRLVNAALTDLAKTDGGNEDG